MKAILINVTDETVQQVEISDDNVLQDMYKHIGCSTVQVAMDIEDNSDSVYVDEEGLFVMDNDSKFFTIKGGHQPFIGNGLVVGLDYTDGVSVDCHTPVEELRSMVKFHNMSEVTRMV